MRNREAVCERHLCRLVDEHDVNRPYRFRPRPQPRRPSGNLPGRSKRVHHVPVLRGAREAPLAVLRVCYLLDRAQFQAFLVGYLEDLVEEIAVTLWLFEVIPMRAPLSTSSQIIRAPM